MATGLAEMVQCIWVCYRGGAGNAALWSYMDSAELGYCVGWVFFLGLIRLLGRYLIGSLGGCSVNISLAMGRAGMGLVFVGLVPLGLIWRRGLAMLRYGIFSSSGLEQADC